MLELFYLALRDKLIADPVLKALTGDNRVVVPPIFRIYREKPEKVATYPNLCFVVNFDEDFDPSMSLGMKRSYVTFTPQAKDELTVIRIGDRLDILAKQYGKPQHQQWFDISNNDVTNKMTKYNNRDNTVHNSKTDVWSQEVTMEFDWYLKNPTQIGA